MRVSAQDDHVVFHSDLEAEALNDPSDVLRLFLAIDPILQETHYAERKEAFESIIEKLYSIKDRASDDLVFLEKMFYRVHRKQLGWYEGYTTVSDVLQSKKYDCLSGTALYALILDYLGYDYTIQEFDFHIFLVLNIEGVPVLLEPTDPYDGFVTDRDEIALRYRKALKSVEESGNFQKTYIQNEISLQQLAGLQYYNQAVDSFNNGHFKEATDLIMKAEMLYPSERIKGVQDIFLSANR